jgi:hypothetical protein
MCYRNERYHDHLLIRLASDLAQHSVQGLELLQTTFGIQTPLGQLERACTRRAFDVELTFTNASLIIETKVDSDEDGRWQQQWQTERIYQHAQGLPSLKHAKLCLFVTYGISEYFTKPYSRGPGSQHFTHVCLDRMVRLLEQALALTLPTQHLPRYEVWLRQMKQEQETREHAGNLLELFGRFRSAHPRLCNEIDFDRNRLLFCGPEIAFPVFGRLSSLWNNDPILHRDLGRVSVYPIGRSSPPIADSILNFRELWLSDPPRPTFHQRLPRYGARAYFEINEDLNLNLRLHEPGPPCPPVPHDVIQDVQNTLATVQYPEGVRGLPRLYQQGTRVIYEWDLEVPTHANNLEAVARRLHGLVSTAIQAVA